MKKKSPAARTRRKPAKRSAAVPAAKGRVALLVGTVKGAFVLRSDPARRAWKLAGPFKLGNAVHHFMLDPRDRKSLLMTAKTGHLGPTIFRSSDWGKTWTEATTPPAFPKAPEGEKGRAVDHVFWLTPGLASQPGVWLAGTSPHGLFRSDDGGANWREVTGFNNHPSRVKWTGGEQDQTPDGPKTHSILIDPRDANRMYIGLSSGGFFVSDDAGGDWRPLNAGCSAEFFPGADKYPEYGHDPHCVRMHPLRPDRLYQQNHCGIYRMDRPDDRWIRIGDNMPRDVGDIGFPIVLHPRDPDVAWVFPMDGTEVWPRTSPGGRPAVFRTRNAGATWERLDRGLPRAHGYFTVFRQAMSADRHDPAGVYFGTTHGQIWASRDEGASWKRICEHLPRVFSVEAAEL